jgi:NADPH2:quinone reductase
MGLHWGLYRRRAPDLVAQVHSELVKLYAEGVVRPLVGQARPFVEAREGYADLAARKVLGKVVLTA